MDISLESGKSPHNEWINWDRLVEIIKGDAELVNSYIEYGPLRHEIVNIFYDGMGIRTKLFTRCIILLDKFWLATFGKLHRSLGPAGIQYAVRKLRKERINDQ